MSEDFNNENEEVTSDVTPDNDSPIFYNDIDVRIYYLNEEEFSNVVEMLEIYATPDN